MFMKRGSARLALLLGLTLLVTGCVSSTQATFEGSFCRVYEWTLLSSADTEATQLAVIKNNLRWKSECPNSVKEVELRLQLVTPHSKP